MIALASMLAVQLRYTESSARKVFLPNDSVVFVQSWASKYTTVTLTLGCPNAPDTPQTYGYRHLIEHLVAKSVPGHDLAIESSGGKLDAETNRDWMRFQWRVAPEMMPAVYSAIRKFLDWKGTTLSEISKESRLIGLERRLLENAQTESINGWQSVFGDAGLDPVGTRESCATATPEQLLSLWRSMVKGGNVSLSIVGDVDRDRALADASACLAGLPKLGGKIWQGRSISGTYGTSSSVALVVPGAGSRGWAAAMIAAFAISSQFDSPFVSVSLSPRPVVALVGSASPTASLKDVLTEENPALLFAVGKGYVRQWISRNLTSSDAISGFQGVLFNASNGLSAQQLWDQVGQADYDEYLRHWRQAKAVAK